MFPRLPRRIGRLLIPGAFALGLLLFLLVLGNQGDTERELLYVQGRLPALSSSSSSSRFADRKRPGEATATTTTTTTTLAPGGGGAGGGGPAGDAAQAQLQRLNSATAAAVTVLAKAGGRIRPEDIVNPHPFSYLINPGEAACRSSSPVRRTEPSPASKDTTRGLLSDSRTHNNSDINSNTNTKRMLVQTNTRTWGINHSTTRTAGGQNGGEHFQTQGQKGHGDPGLDQDQGPVWLLVYLHSAPANLKKRQSIRETWGHPAVLREYNASLVFILGAVADARLQEAVLLESERYGDIVQENFTDTYRNLTYKAIAGLRWAATFCSRATYILKTDDDILVNLHAVVKHLRTVVAPQHGARRLILCNQWFHMKIIRDKKSKWYVSEKEFPGEYFPTYCSGSAFLLSGDMAQLMYDASLVTPFFWVDDYYITGALIQRLAVKHRAVNQAYSLNPGVAADKYRKDSKRELFFFHLHNLRVMYGLWTNMTHVHEADVSTSAPASTKKITSSSSLASH